MFQLCFTHSKTVRRVHRVEGCWRVGNKKWPAIQTSLVITAHAHQLRCLRKGRGMAQCFADLDRDAPHGSASSNLVPFLMWPLDTWGPVNHFFFLNLPVQFPITFSLDHLTLHGQDTIACSAAISACEKAAQWEVALQLLGNTRATRQHGGDGGPTLGVGHSPVLPLFCSNQSKRWNKPKKNIFWDCSIAKCTLVCNYLLLNTVGNILKTDGRRMDSTAVRCKNESRGFWRTCASCARWMCLASPTQPPFQPVRS